MEDPVSDKLEPIAVVGLGCRFPGDATSPQALWDMLLRGDSAWSEFPEDRMNINNYYHPSGTRQGSICFRGAHFLKQNVASFDSSFFGIPADEAKAVDPQQRMLLEVAVEALDSAGIDRNTIRKSETGVWIGSFVKDYEQIVLRDYDDQPQYGATGNGTAIMSNRLSYFLDLSGPSMTIDTGCSASLVCVHQACQSLLTRETDMALAGGAGLILTPNTMMPMTALEFLSPDGRSYTFDSRANGYGRGEGIGIVILKRLKDAIRDNDCIRAVIRGTRLNQDGKTPGITLPSTEAQIRNMRSVYERAGLDPIETAYVECHGTGTQAGDTRELAALSQSISRGRTIDDPVYVGSIKTNLGHLEGAAGIAGVIKGILAVENGIIPKHINFLNGNPAIDFTSLKVKVPLENTPWPTPGLRRASVNSFGFGGTNAHAILDDAAYYLAARGLSAHHNSAMVDQHSGPSTPDHELASAHAATKNRRVEIGLQNGGLNLPDQDFHSHVFVFSAHDQSSLLRLLDSHAEHITKSLKSSSISANFTEELAYTLGCRRTKLSWRTAVAAKSPEELVSKLKAVKKESLRRSSELKAANIAFVFSGQGSQWYAMGRELLAFDIYLESISAASDYMTHKLGSTFNLLAELLKDETATRINEPDISQPATTAIQVAMVDFLVRYCSLVPNSVVGHSSGEIAAAYASGMISRETAWELAYHRGLAAASLLQTQEAATHANGRMIAVGLSAAAATTYVRRVGGKRIDIACINSPISVTLSGDEDAISEIQGLLNQDGIFNRLLVVDIAYHSHHMLRCLQQYHMAIAHLVTREPTHHTLRHPHEDGKLLTPADLVLNSTNSNSVSNPASTRMFSSLFGAEAKPNHLSCKYWVANMACPVRFCDAITAMVQGSEDKVPDIILEIGPHSVLHGPLQQIFASLPGNEKPPLCLSMLRRKTDATMTALDAIGSLWSHGCNIDLSWVVMRNIQLGLPKLMVDLPNYPWNHDDTHWHESHLSRSNRLTPHGRYDLIGRPTPDSIPFQPRWRGFFRVKENPWLQHHQVQKTTIYPAAGMVSMILEGARQLMSEKLITGIEIAQFSIEKAMLIPATDHGLEYALNMSKQDHPKRHRHRKSSFIQHSAPVSTSYEFFIYSKPLNRAWQQHGTGLVTIHSRTSPAEDYHDKEAAAEIALKTKRYFENYRNATNDCDEMILPRQLYETLDVIGMNYGPLFQNITSLAKRENTCTFVVRVPDTKSVMPAQFEYPHVLHPATLDSVFQTAFSFGDDSMVPSYIGKIYVSMDPSLPSGAGKELVGYATAERQGLREANVTFAMSDESWKHSDLSFAKEPLVVIKDMKFTALSSGSQLGSANFIPSHQSLCSELKWEQVPAESIDNIAEAHTENQLPGDTFILIPENMSLELTALCCRLYERSGCTSATLAETKHWRKRPSYCISLLEILPKDHAIWDWSAEEFDAFKSLVMSTKGLVWVTRSATIDPTNPKSGLFQALARTIRSENPQKNLVALDLDANTDAGSASTMEFIATLASSVFSRTGQLESRETDYAVRHDQLLVSRLVPMPSINRMINRGKAPAEPIVESLSQHQNRLLKLKIGEIGNPETLYWDDDHKTSQPLAKQNIAIKVLAAGLGALDVDIITGCTRDHALGTDVFGTIVALGDDVTDFEVGDHVVAVARGTVRQQVRCHQSQVYTVPADTDPSVVLLPTAFALADFALRTKITLKKGESILIHAGAGSFGQAAIRLAQHIGAEVFTTVTTEVERQILRHDHHLSDNSIFDGNSTSFIESILRLTRNKGVDVVFDPTSEYRATNTQCVAKSGHIMCFPKKDTEQRPSIDFTGNTFSVHTIDLANEIRKEPPQLKDALRFLWTTDFKSFLPECCSEVKRYDWSDLPTALNALMEDSLCGMAYCGPSTDTRIPIMPHPGRHIKDSLHAEGTYVLAGQGGLAMQITRLLEANGVKHIALFSRSGAVSAASQTTISFLENRGVSVKIVKVDICDRTALQKELEVVKQTMPPIRGLFQCAAALRDAVFDTMTYESWQTAIMPKTIGSWNLYELFPQDMDFFIFLSSSVGIIGNRGQSNYAAGNAFQDALARHISSSCNNGGTMRSVSIDLGPVLGAGMLAEDPRTLDKLKATGFFGVRLQDFERVVERAITGYAEGDERLPAQIVMGVGTGGLMRQNKPADPYWTRTALFTHLNQVDLPPPRATSEDIDFADEEEQQEQETVRQLVVRATGVSNARRIVTTGLCAVLAASMGKQAEDVDENRPPSAYGVDSLVAVGIRNWVQRECDVDVSVFEVLSDTSVVDLSAIVVERGGFGKSGGGIST